MYLATDRKGMTPPKRLLAPALSAALVLALMAMAPSALAKPAAAKVRSFHGTVSAVSRDHHVFRVRRAGKASVRIRVARSTKRAKGLRLKKGQSLRVRARHTRRGWVATRLVVVRAAPRGGDGTGPGTGPGAGDDPAFDDEDTPADEDPAGEDGVPGGDDPGAGAEDPPDQDE